MKLRIEPHKWAKSTHPPGEFGERFYVPPGIERVGYNSGKERASKGEIHPGAHSGAGALGAAPFYNDVVCVA